MLIRFVKGIFEVQDAESIYGKEEVTRGMIGDYLRKKVGNPERALKHLYKHPRRWFQIAEGRLSFAKRIRLRIKMQTVAKRRLNYG
jgi:hypothetical protein